MMTPLARLLCLVPLIGGLLDMTFGGSPALPKVLSLKKLETGVTVDGVIDPSWSLADSVMDFVQYQPYNGKDPSRRTMAKVFTTETSLYCLMVCQDKPSDIQLSTGQLDNTSGDIVSIMLDTFGDKRTAYKFAVTASGVRADCRLLDDARDRDYSWDGVWFASSKMYDSGFVVEMEIPYRSIQYDETLPEWGLDFDRWIPARTEDIYWCAYGENEGQRVSKFGKLHFQDFRPSVKGLNFEVYPVGISKATYLGDDTYKVEPNAGIDLFYNPSQKLTFQLTGNPDFAQIEADPYDFNISRYETYFSERRPFFTEGNEIFMASGRERNSGFYRPLELFYSRRIGKKLPDGSEVPLLVGTKAFGRLSEWQYGGFMAMTGEQDYTADSQEKQEPRALFGSARITKQVFGNSSVGALFVGKHSEGEDEGVIDLDGAFRSSDWQLAYQLARSFKNAEGDFALSTGFKAGKETWLTAVRARYIGDHFDIQEVGYVPWIGTSEITALSGPRWPFTEGALRSILLYAGTSLYYENVDQYMDHAAVLGWNMDFRSNWGYEVDLSTGKSRDQNVEYTSYEVDVSAWCNVRPSWSASLNGSYAKTYNFQRAYLAPFANLNASFGWLTSDILSLGTSVNLYVEGNPDNNIEEITYNTRPYVSLSPVNDLNVRMYFDNVFLRSTRHLQQTILGVLFSYNFMPKSWIYLAVNEMRDRSVEYDGQGFLLDNRLHLVSRAAVLKVKYLYYF